MNASFFGDLLQTIIERGRDLIGSRGVGGRPTADLEAMGNALISGRGEASGVAMADEMLNAFDARDRAGRLAFLLALADRFGPDHARLARAVAAYGREASPAVCRELHEAAEPLRQRLIRRLNAAPNGTLRLVRMREAVLAELPHHRELAAVDADFVHLFASWFNRGFLVMRAIDWTTPATVLEKIIRYEAVHEIDSWDDLRRRLAPSDRRCFAFFHPALADEPLIFVEVALTDRIPAAIAPLLADGRPVIEPDNATAAVFYSISNCQDGLRGISFGSFLIKQVVVELKRALPKLETFVTLSPVPGFMDWIAAERTNLHSTLLTADDRAALGGLGQADWHDDEAVLARLRGVLPAVAARYLLHAKASSGKPHDPVARFHLGNGARLERINPFADLSPRGLARGGGLMVNYLYDPRLIEANHEAYENANEVAAAPAVRRLARTGSVVREFLAAEG